MRLDWQGVDYNGHNSADVVAIDAKVIHRFAVSVSDYNLRIA